MGDRVGQQLGNYQLLRLIGQGGFADVYLGEHVHLRTQAAIKVLQVRLVDTTIQNFLNEARTIAHLIHPYIIRVLDFGVQDNVPFLVMDYAPRGTFRQRFLQGKPLPSGPLVPYMKQTAAALQYGHDRKLIHRDVKPENMLLGPGDQILLADFGLALIAYNSVSRSPTETAGTAAYMAPEQLQGQPRAASDQYSLGVIAYEWLTGAVPFEGSFFEIASQQVLQPIPRMRDKNPAIPTDVEQVIMKALEKDPQRRFPNAKDFALALEEACLISRQYSFEQDPTASTIRPMSPVMTKQPDSSVDSPVRSDAQEASSSKNAGNSFQDTTFPIQQSSPVSQSRQAAFPAAWSSGSQSASTPLFPSGPLSAPFPTFTPTTNATPDSTKAANAQNSFGGMPPVPPSTPTAAGAPNMSSLQGLSPLSTDSNTNRPSYPAVGVRTGQGPSQVRQYLMGGVTPEVELDPLAGSPLLNNMPGINTFNSAATTTTTPNTTFQPQTRPATEPHATAPFTSPPLRRIPGTMNVAVLAIIGIVVLIIAGSAIELFTMSGNMSKKTVAQTISTATPISKPTAQPTRHVQAKPIAPQIVQETNPYATTGTLVLNDSLVNSQGNWQQGTINATGGTCTLKQGIGYELDAPIIDPGACYGQQSYTNFAYEVQMKFTQIGQLYSGGGIVFRANSNNNQYYYFEVFQDGTYTLQICNAGDCVTTLDGYKVGKAAITSFVPGLNITNTLAVVAKNNYFALFVNKQLVTDVPDLKSTYTSGTIGVMATGGNNQGLRTADTSTTTVAIFTDAKVWVLK
ncbi:serine/threonine protein kinase [Ktedonobacteria bacterium brp13]|nr:serine/threonine protein kinase [Ktedonobacteria bacterium brp13]